MKLRLLLITGISIVIISSPLYISNPILCGSLIDSRYIKNRVPEKMESERTYLTASLLGSLTDT